MWSLLLLEACRPGEFELPEVSTELSETELPSETEPPEVTSSTDSIQDVADAFYAPDHVVEISIEIAEDDALALAAQTNDLFDLLLGEDCMSEPWKGPFTWFSADVTVDGTPLLESGIRKKGLIGSLSEDKPSLKVEFDEFVAGQTYLGLEHLTLNNSISDSSLVKQCLGYWLFAQAGMPAPRCNFAHVTANGDDLGVYVNVEPPKKMFLRNAFGEDDGDLYEGTVSDFREGWTGTFEPDTDQTDEALGPILEVTAALALPDDAEMLSALERVVDLPQFYRFWALETLIGHLDGYTGNTNNFYVYFPDSSHAAEFVPWGIDGTFYRTAEIGSDPTMLVQANSQLARELWDTEAGRDGYLSALGDLLDTVWEEDAMIAEIDRMAALVEPYAAPDAYRPIAQDALRDFVLTRKAEMQELVAGEMPEFPDPLRDAPCIEYAGELQVDFATTWGTLGSYYPLSEGASTITGTLAGAPFDYSGAALAGEDTGYGILAAVALTGPTVVTEAVVYLPLEAFVPGEIAINGFTQPAYLFQVDFAVSDQAVLLGSMWGGVLVLTEASTAPDGVVSGYLEGPLYSGGF